MWLYPLPALVASAGFVYMLLSRNNAFREIRYAGMILVAGTAIFLVRAWRRQEWPFGDSSLIVGR
jgi:APA family basic amino acid/polyamine antiporter